MDNWELGWKQFKEQLRIRNGGRKYVARSLGRFGDFSISFGTKPYIAGEDAYYIGLFPRRASPSQRNQVLASLVCQELGVGQYASSYQIKTLYGGPGNPKYWFWILTEASSVTNRHSTVYGDWGGGFQLNEFVPIGPKGPNGEKPQWFFRPVYSQITCNGLFPWLNEIWD
jgi:hypothetical protein